MSELTLYYRPTCPYCRKVLGFMQEKNIDVPLKDIGADPSFQQELVATGGKSQVPCLIIDGKPLYESDDIIQWMGENLTK